jgi:hypothetical protein
MKIEFSNEQLQILNDAIQEMPFKVAAPLIAHINKEIQARFNESIDVKESDDGNS